MTWHPPPRKAETVLGTRIARRRPDELRAPFATSPSTQVLCSLGRVGDEALCRRRVTLIAPTLALGRLGTELRIAARDARGRRDPRSRAAGERSTPGSTGRQDDRP